MAFIGTDCAYTEQEIRNNIYYNEGLVSDYQSDIQRLEREIEELESSREKVVRKQTEFHERQTVRKNHLSGGSAEEFKTKIYPAYYRGMSDLLTGTKYLGVDELLEETIAEINQKILTREQELETAQGNLTYRSGRVQYWYDQLRLLIGTR